MKETCPFGQASFLYLIVFTLFRLQTLSVFAGREAEVLGAIATEIREGGEVHGVGYLGERQAFVV